MYRHFLFSILLSAPLFLLISCSNSDKTDINTVLNNRIKSFETKDEVLYSNCIDNNYEQISDGETVNKQSLIKDFKINVSPFDQIKFSKSEREFHVNRNVAKIVIETSVDLTIKDQKTRYNTTELITLTKLNGEWKITKESKLDLFRGFVFGEKKF